MPDVKSCRYAARSNVRLRKKVARHKKDCHAATRNGQPVTRAVLPWTPVRCFGSWQCDVGMSYVHSPTPSCTHADDLMIMLGACGLTLSLPANEAVLAFSDQQLLCNAALGDSVLADTRVRSFSITVNDMNRVRHHADVHQVSGDLRQDSLVSSNTVTYVHSHHFIYMNCMHHAYTAILPLWRLTRHGPT